MSDLIEDLLVAGRPEERIRIELRRLSLRTALESLAQAGDGVVCESGDAVAMGDPMRGRQILRNLLTNAQRYGGPNTWVSFGVGDMVSITVADDGAGVAAGHEERIFIPFVSAPVTKVSLAASGLGLTVSRPLASLMDADIVYERSNGWTRFTFELPMG